MKDLNMVFLMGNLTRDPELRYTPNGQAVANFTVATNRQWKDAEGNQQDAAEFTDIVVWGKIAETVANYLKKGRRVHVIGRLQSRSWEAQDGSKRSKTEVVATDVTFLDRKGDSGSDFDGVDALPKDDGNQDKKRETTKAKDKSKKDTEEEIDIEDIPF
ncbi:MAG: single-stranded DNA-binding protein [Patescibacteria group bacterium]|nr:single-stranded DNA-binding protein [Patescibacteria group bacterium]